MPKVEIIGMEALTSGMNSLLNDITKINNMALYDAAGVAASEIANALQNLPTHSDDEYGTENHPLYGATASEKAQIIQNFGISRFKNNGSGSQTSIGFTGYVNTKSRKFNNQVPTGMLMQCIEYGTAFRKGTHTVSKAIKAAKERMMQAAQERIDQEVQKLNL